MPGAGLGAGCEMVGSPDHVSALVESISVRRELNIIQRLAVLSTDTQRVSDTGVS